MTRLILFSETHSTARLTVPVRRSAQGDKIGLFLCHPEERSDEGSLKNNTRKRQNHAFAFFTLQRGAARRKGEGCARFIKVCPEKRAVEENSDCSARRAYNGVFLKITENRRRQLAEIFVNQLPTSPSSQ